MPVAIPPVPSLRHVASLDGTRIAVHRSGEGPPLVLVHGAAADHSRWRPVLPALERRFTVLAVDRRGRGGSGDAAAYALEREVEDVVAVVEAAGEPVALLGHSHGAVCALEAARLTGGVRALVLYEPPLGFVRWPAGVAGDSRRSCRRAGGTRCWRSSCRRSPDCPPTRSRICGPCRRGRAAWPPRTPSRGRSA